MDELLERIWTQREKGSDQCSESLIIIPVENGKDWLQHLKEEGLVSLEDGNVLLTTAGESEARQIIRRHRLTERLFADVFDTREEVWERQACELEHAAVLTEDAVSAVCAFLGHPPTCPHGRSIPPGACCSEFQKEVKAFVIPLTEGRVSENYRIVFMTPKNPVRLDRLSVLGILPGSIIRMHQKRPTYVIRIGETDVALDGDLVKDIFVRKSS